MLERPLSFLRLQKIFSFWIFGMLFAVGIALVGFSILLYRPISVSVNHSHHSDNQLEKKASVAQVENICSVLFAEGTPLDTTLTHISNELFLWEYQLRPDQPEENVCLLGCGASDEVKVAYNGDVVYLDCDKGKLCFAKTPTTLAVRCEKHQERGDWTLQPCWGDFPEKKEHARVLREEQIIEQKYFTKKYTRVLQDVIAYPPDVLFLMYGGPVYRHLQGLYRLEIPHAQGTTISFAQEKDCLIWENGKWRKSLPAEDTRSRPLLQIENISQEGITVSIFQPNTHRSMRFTVKVKNIQPSHHKWMDIFKKAKRRTRQTVSCRLQGKMVTLKSGDWWLETPRGWRPIRSLDEIKAFLDYRVAMPVLIIDKIGKEGYHDSYLLGHYFDEKRCSAEEIKIVLVENKKTRDSRRKKNLSSGTMHGYGSAL